MSKLLLSSRPVSDVDPGEPPVTGRTTVFDIDFNSNYENNLPWQFVNAGFDPNTMSERFTTLNGADAVAVTWEAGAAPNDRWGGFMTLPSAYEECWLTVDVMFVSPFSNPQGMKLPGLKPDNFNQSTRGCANGWAIRNMLSADGSDHTDPRHAHLYPYDTSQNGPQNKVNWDSGAEVIPLDTVARIELYFKLNTAFNQSNGIAQVRYDVGTSTTHATPTTLRAQFISNFYCGSESNRNPSRATKIDNLLFFGGNTSAWSPNIDSEVIFGRQTLEVPA